MLAPSAVVAAGAGAAPAPAVAADPVVGTGPGGDAPALETGAWEAWGPAVPEPLPAGGLRLHGNTGIVSAPFAVPARAQALRLRVAAPGRAALVRVAALPVEGGPAVELGTREPARAPGEVTVALAPVAGRTVRLMVDPVAAFGAALEVHRVGPVVAPLPRWRIAAGAVDLTPRVHGAIRVAEDELDARSPAIALGRGAAAVLVRVRGDGVVRAVAGGRTVALRAGTAWRDLRVPVRAGRRSAVLRLRVAPGDGVVDIRDIGTVVRRVRLAAVRARPAGGRLAVSAVTVPATARAGYVVRDARGRVIARGRTDAAGRLRARPPHRSGPLRVSLTASRTVIPVPARVSAPG